MSQSHSLGQSERWQLTYDDGQQEDAYVLRPSEKEINHVRLAAPDAKTALYHSPRGYEWNLVQEWPPLRDEG
jgi:hypothetical protein